MSASRMVRLALALFACGLLSVLAVAAASDNAASDNAASPPPPAPAASFPTPSPSVSYPPTCPAPAAPYSAPTAPYGTPATPYIRSGTGSYVPATPSGGYDGRPYPCVPEPYALIPPDPKKANVMLKDGSRLVGDLVETGDLKVVTEYGQVSIPAKLVSCIRRLGLPGKISVQMRSGDRVTGQLEGTTLKLKTVWGEVSIEMQHVVCVTWPGASSAYPPIATRPSPGWPRPMISPARRQ